MHNLFWLAPPDGRDWKVVEVAQEIAPAIAAAGFDAKVLVVANDEHMNFLSLQYALQRMTRAKFEVQRVYGMLDEAQLAGFTRAVLVLPPPDETPVSRHSIQAAQLVASRSGWVAEAKLERGDGREIWIMAPRATPAAP